MSFILDALRKSEHARQKHSGPGFAEVPIVVAKSRTNVWATAAVVLLVVNLLAVGVLMLRRANPAATPEPVTEVPSTTAPVVASPPPAVPASETAMTATTPGSAGPTLAPPASVTPGAAPPRPRTPDSGRNPLAAEVGDAGTGADASRAAAAASVPAGPPAVTRQPARRGSVVYAPIPEASDAPSPARAAAPAVTAAESLPSADEVTARGGLPALHLDLHVYSTVPQQRFIFVNSRKYREGDALQEGPVVERITTHGAVLNYRGSRFELSND